jgi:CDP-diacylglycerol--glycerol-3-phosphate 3-phosphatidyltransferase
MTTSEAASQHSSGSGATPGAASRSRLGRLKEQLPNALCLLRILAAPPVAFLLWLGPSYRFAATGLFVLASLTDYLDGYLARRWHVVSDLGIFFDLTADKLFVSTILIVMVDTNMIAPWMVIVIIGREFIVSGLRSYAAAKGVVIPASPWGKSKTLVTLVALAAAILRVDATLTWWLLLAATILTIVSAVDYVAKTWRASFPPRPLPDYEKP